MKITDLVKKPSEALQAMVDGLETQSKRPDFIIRMNTFGAVDVVGWGKAKTCYGCCATCTVQQIAKRDLDSRSINDVAYRARALCFDSKMELDYFENAVDDARLGNLRSLFQFFYGNEEYSAMKIDRSLVYPDKIHYTDDNWQEQNILIREHILKLQKAGY